ncbi:MAG: M48 family metalloprotease [Spirochaetaceae bacterium]|nr:M48 family metalloprotease [Spirochaetaceae bacterium]
MKIVKILLLCLVMAVVFSSCAVMKSMGGLAAAVGDITGNDNLSAMGDSVAAVAEASAPISPEQEYYIGRSVTASLLGSYKVFQSPELTNYVNMVCQVLAMNSQRPQLYKGYYVAVLDTDQINAFASSGGHILVTRGLLECATSEDALAAVLAHEIAHIQLQHGIKAIKGDRWTNAALTTATSSLTVLSDGEMKEVIDAFDESVNGVITTMVNTGYSQSQEYDADETALEIMAAAGYNPHAMTEMLNELKVRQPKSSGGFASTHPSADKRLKQVEKKLKKYAAISVPETRVARYNHMMAIY